jgi:polar amino acid transport system substrate-binding protein
MGRLWAVVLIVLLGFARCALAEDLRVGVAGSPPFVVTAEGGAVDGLAVELWAQVATRLGLHYRLVPMRSVDGALHALSKGELDVAIGPISITAARSREVSFTQPYFRATLGILTHSSPPTLWQRVRPFLSAAFLTGVGILLLVLVVVGSGIWLAERGQNSGQFPRRLLPGIGNGMWLALVTMTTVGYGDRAPVTPIGRLLTGVWMVVTLITVSTLTAGLASAFTVSNLAVPVITSVDDLEGRPIAVVTGTTGAEYARRHGGRILGNAVLRQAVAQVVNGQADAVVFDRPALQYLMHSDASLPVRLLRSSFEAQNYGFALLVGSPRLHAMNVELLTISESGDMADLQRKWLGAAVE